MDEVAADDVAMDDVAADGSLLDHLMALERAVWEALVRGDAAADRALLAADFLGVDPDGCSGRDDHARRLAGGPAVAWFAIRDARAVDVAPGAALLAYRAEYRRPGGASEPEAMYVTSLWQQRAGTWVNTFSQDTPVARPGDPRPV